MTSIRANSTFIVLTGGQLRLSLSTRGIEGSIMFAGLSTASERQDADGRMYRRDFQRPWIYQESSKLSSATVVSMCEIGQLRRLDGN